MNLVKFLRVDFEKVDIGQIGCIFVIGDLDLFFEEQWVYYDLMEMVCGLCVCMRYNGKVIIKVGIIWLFKFEVYGFFDWMVWQVYVDFVNFFYSQENICLQVFVNFYVEKLEKWVDFMFLMGKGEEVFWIFEWVVRFWLCFVCDEQEIFQEFLNRKFVVIYICDWFDMGVLDMDCKELEVFIDFIFEVFFVVCERVKEDVCIKKFDLKKRMLEDVEEFGGQDV